MSVDHRASKPRTSDPNPRRVALSPVADEGSGSFSVVHPVELDAGKEWLHGSGVKDDSVVRDGDSVHLDSDAVWFQQ
jgi:hypothetical protein